MPESNPEGECSMSSLRVYYAAGMDDALRSLTRPPPHFLRAADPHASHVRPGANSYWRSALRDLMAGTLGGIAGKLIEFPFDTVKVRLQAGGENGRPVYSGPMDCFRRILQHEGVRTLYKGMSMPLAGTVVETATLFSANGYLKRKLAEAGQISKGDYLPLSYVLASGAGTGFVVSFVLTPTELVKCRLQVQVDTPGACAAPGTPAPYKGPLDCLTRSIREEGLAVVYRGHVGTMLREIPGTACWFGAYESFLRSMTPAGTSREQLSSLTVVTAGALGGMSYWAVMYPADTIKSSMQIAHVGRDSGAAAAAVQAISSSSSSGSGNVSSSVSSSSSSSSSATTTTAAAAQVRGSVPPHSLASAARAAPFSTLARRLFSSSSAGSSAAAAAVSSSVGEVMTPEIASSFTRTASYIYRTRGLPGLYAGLTPTLIRAAPSNAVIFLVYEWSSQAIGRWMEIDD